MSAPGRPAKRRKGRPVGVVSMPPTEATVRSAPAAETVARPAPASTGPPFLLDFFPLEEPRFTRLAPFYEALRKGRVTTTKCRRDGTVAWPPRVVCPKCHTAEVDWVDLPTRGHVYAFSAVLGGAPLGMEADVPFVVGLVDLEGAPLRLFGRIVGVGWEACRIGLPVVLEPFDLPDGRVFYRFRAGP